MLARICVLLTLSIVFTSISFCLPPYGFPVGKLKIDCKKAKTEAREKKKKANKKYGWPPMSP